MFVKFVTQKLKMNAMGKGSITNNINRTLYQLLMKSSGICIKYSVTKQIPDRLNNWVEKKWNLRVSRWLFVSSQKRDTNLEPENDKNPTWFNIMECVRIKSSLNENNNNRNLEDYLPQR